MDQAAIRLSPRLVEPLEGQNVGEEQPYLTWTIGSGGGPLLGQVLAYQYGDLAEKDASWPDARLKVFPPEPRQGKVAALAGSRRIPHELVRLVDRSGRAGRGGAGGAFRSGTIAGQVEPSFKELLSKTKATSAESQKTPHWPPGQGQQVLHQPSKSSTLGRSWAKSSLLGQASRAATRSASRQFRSSSVSSA